MRYEDATALLADAEQQFARGGLLVRVEPLPEVELFAPVRLVVSTPFGSVTIAAQIIQMMPGLGVAVGFSVEAVPGLPELLDAARSSSEGTAQGGATSAKTGRSERTGRPARARRAAPVDARTKLKNATKVEKVQIALHGSKEERMLILRDSNRLLHQYVLKNSKIQLDEVAHIAGMRTVGAEVLQFIGGRREWAQRPEVALALVRNPKTPVPLAVKMVNFVSPQQLRQLAKGTSVRPPIQKAVRKKVLR